VKSIIVQKVVQLASSVMHTHTLKQHSRQALKEKKMPKDMTQSHTLKQPSAIIFAHPKFRYEYLRAFQVSFS
jgi:hypothetical protein